MAPPGDRTLPATMRLCTLHPRHLDARGLVALWREGLLVLAEARRRGYRFDARLVRGPRIGGGRIRVTTGPLRYEWSHLLRKLRARSPATYRAARGLTPRAHGLFRLTPGSVALWEVRSRGGRAR